MPPILKYFFAAQLILIAYLFISDHQEILSKSHIGGIVVYPLAVAFLTGAIYILKNK